MKFLIALALGAATAFAFEPHALWPLMPLAFALLCYLIDQAPRLRSALAIGWGFGVGQFAVGLNWIATAFTFQAAMPAWLGWIAVVQLSLYLAVYPMLAAGLAWRFGRDRPVALVLALAGGWIVCEWLRATMFTGFSWNPLGAVLVDTPWRATLPWIGTYALSAVTVAAGGCLWLAARKQFTSAGVIAAVLAALTLLGSIFRYAPDVEIASVRIVQPNIGQQDKWRDGFAAEAARKLDGLSIRPGSAPPRLLLWPEAAVTEPLYDERKGLGADEAAIVRRRAAASLRANDLLLTGGIGLLARDGQRISGATNSVFVIDPAGRILDRYDKAHLVPYGEYLPMRPLLSAIGLSRLAPGDLDFAAGPGARTVALPTGMKVGFQLCYEIIFSGEVVDRTNRPNLIFNPSNDAWFGRWGPPQHLAQARLRAAEEGISVVRATPTGISAIVGPDGSVIKSLPWQTEGVIDGVIVPELPPGPFARFGNAIPVLLGALLLMAGIVLGRRRGYSARNI